MTDEEYTHSDAVREELAFELYEAATAVVEKHDKGALSHAPTDSVAIERLRVAVSSWICRD